MLKNLPNPSFFFWFSVIFVCFIRPTRYPLNPNIHLSCCTALGQHTVFHPSSGHPDPFRTVSRRWRPARCWTQKQCAALAIVPMTVVRVRHRCRMSSTTSRQWNDRPKRTHCAKSTKPLRQLANMRPANPRRRLHPRTMQRVSVYYALGNHSS